MFSVVGHKRQNSAAGECGKFAASIVRALSSKKHTRRTRCRLGVCRTSTEKNYTEKAQKHDERM